MKLDHRAPGLRSLLDDPSPARLTLHGEDGHALTSPVWFRVTGAVVEMVIPASDRKLRHLRRDPDLPRRADQRRSRHRA